LEPSALGRLKILLFLVFVTVAFFFCFSSIDSAIGWRISVTGYPVFA
jgi:hypothetical protein